MDVIGTYPIPSEQGWILHLSDPEVSFHCISRQIWQVTSMNPIVPVEKSNATEKANVFEFCLKTLNLTRNTRS
jgi:hypothetical protein